MAEDSRLDNESGAQAEGISPAMLAESRRFRHLPVSPGVREERSSMCAPGRRGGFLPPYKPCSVTGATAGVSSSPP